VVSRPEDTKPRRVPGKDATRGKEEKERKREDVGVVDVRARNGRRGSKGDDNTIWLGVAAYGSGDTKDMA
jgi:hypothetical protein